MIFLSRIQKKAEEWLIPPADAVVNPKAGGLCVSEQIPVRGSRCLEADLGIVRRHMVSHGDEIMDFTELAAVATVGDVMDLQGENRIIVKEGLRQLSATTYFSGT